MSVAFTKHTVIAAAGAALFLSTPASAAELPREASMQHHEFAAELPLGDLTAKHDRKYKRRDRHDYDDDRYYGDRYRGDQSYSRYGEPVHRNTRVWRGGDGRYYCRKENGTTGLLIGAGVGGLIGNEVAGRGDKGVGILLGAVGGAILGREIDRSNSRCR